MMKNLPRLLRLPRNPGRKGRPVGSKPISHENLMHAASLPTGPNTPVSRERACQPRATMRSTGHGDGFYVVMNGRIMGVFNSWYGEETYSSLLLNCLQGILLRGRILASPHQSYRKFPSLRDALVTWDETWSNQEIGYPADRHSNQSRYGPEWVRSQQHITAKLYWVVVKGHVPGLYNTL